MNRLTREFNGAGVESGGGFATREVAQLPRYLFRPAAGLGALAAASRQLANKIAAMRASMV